MNEDVNQELLEIIRYWHKECGSDSLVDVFRVWDCYEQDWIDESPIVLRFEINDVLAWSEGGMHHFKAGAVDTANPSSIPHVVSNQTEEDRCLCWRSDLSMIETQL